MSDAVKEINVSLDTLRGMAKSVLTPAKRNKLWTLPVLMVRFDGESGSLAMVATDRFIIVEHKEVVASPGAHESFDFYVSTEALEAFCKTKSSLCTVDAEGFRTERFAAFAEESWDGYETAFGTALKIMRETWEEQDYWQSKEVDTEGWYVGVNVGLLSYLKDIELLPRLHYAHKPTRFANRGMSITGIIMPFRHIDS